MLKQRQIANQQTIRMTIRRIFIFKQGLIGDKSTMFLNLNDDHKIIKVLEDDIQSVEEKFFVTIVEIVQSKKMYNVS